MKPKKDIEEAVFETTFIDDDTGETRNVRSSYCSHHGGNARMGIMSHLGIFSNKISIMIGIYIFNN